MFYRREDGSISLPLIGTTNNSAPVGTARPR